MVIVSGSGLVLDRVSYWVSLVGSLVGRLVGWFVGWFVRWLVGWLVVHFGSERGQIQRGDSNASSPNIHYLHVSVSLSLSLSVYM